jgi:NADPH:quinone reductase-like Zn-dependent oxidoreductase
MSIFVQQQTIADPFELEVVDRPEPHAGAGEVRVRVRAAGLNPVDWKIATNPQAAAAFGVTLPAGFGNDFAGEIDEVGDGVEGVEAGDRVYGGARGRAVAEHVVVTPEGLLRTPDGVSDEVASTLPIAGRTADAVLHVVGVAAGETVLVGGAAGGVGVLTVQLARAAGATVIGTASESNHEFLRSLGVIPVVYGDGLADRVRAVAPNGVDAAIDLQGTETVLAAEELGVPGERIATIAAGPTPPGGAIATGGTAATDGALERIAQGLAEGTLIMPIAATFPVDRVTDAVALQRSGHVRGKVVVTI